MEAQSNPILRIGEVRRMKLSTKKEEPPKGDSSFL